VTPDDLEALAGLLRRNPELCAKGALSLWLASPGAKRQARLRAKRGKGVTISKKSDAPKSLEKPRKQRKLGWRRVPGEWQPNDRHREIATAEGVDIDRAVEDFRDHEFKTPRKDPDATFRVWLRSPFQATKTPVRGAWGGRTNDAGPAPPPGWLPHETPMARAARITREEAEREARERVAAE
jgi:hypothetical protein